MQENGEKIAIFSLEAGDTRMIFGTMNKERRGLVGGKSPSTEAIAGGRLLRSLEAGDTRILFGAINKEGGDYSDWRRVEMMKAYNEPQG